MNKKVVTVVSEKSEPHFAKPTSTSTSRQASKSVRPGANNHGMALIHEATNAAAILTRDLILLYIRLNHDPPRCKEISSMMLKKRFHIGSICIVADRGMISKGTIEQLQAKERNVQFTLGARLRNVKEIREKILFRGTRYHEVHSSRQRS